MQQRYQSFAKVNLSLHVLGRRADDYHELRTIFQTVGLSDVISIEPVGAGIELTVSAGQAPAGEANLAHTAARRFTERWAPDLGVRIDLQKRIPIGGGLGGGSSNAACVLRALAELVQLPTGDPELRTLAAELGADVPYFLVGGTVLGRGRGDELQPLPDLPERAITLVTPPVSISTAEVFGGLAAPGIDSAAAPGNKAESHLEADWESLTRETNDLEGPVFERYPIVADVYNALVEAGAIVVRLSGTGATLFAFFDAEAVVPELATRLPAGCRVEQTRTLTRSSLERHRVVR